MCPDGQNDLGPGDGTDPPADGSPLLQPGGAAGCPGLAGCPGEAAQTQAYLQELEEDLVTVDELIAFAQSAAGRQVFGPEAANVAAHGRALKEAGARFCDCPACQAAAAILTETDRLH